MENHNGWKNCGHEKEWHLETHFNSKRSQSHRHKIGIQGEEKYLRWNREAPGKTSGKRLQSESRVDYNEVFALVVQLETIRLIISLAAQNKWKIHRIDVKSIFLNGVLEEKVCIEQPMGYTVEGQEDRVLKLKRLFTGWNKHNELLIPRLTGTLKKMVTGNVPTSTLSTSRSKTEMP